MISNLRACASLIGLLALGGAATSASPRPVPPFTVTLTDGASLASESLCPEGRCLLIYVRPDCQPCDELLNVWHGVEPPEWASRVTVIAGGMTAAEADALRERVPALFKATWAIDDAGSARDALDVGGAPATFGLDGGVIEWSLYGVFDTTRSTLTNWVK